MHCMHRDRRSRDVLKFGRLWWLRHIPLMRRGILSYGLPAVLVPVVVVRVFLLTEHLQEILLRFFGSYVSSRQLLRQKCANIGRARYGLDFINSADQSLAFGRRLKVFALRDRAPIHPVIRGHCASYAVIRFS